MEPDLRPAPLMRRYIRLHPDVPVGGATHKTSLSKPRPKQNPFANPNRTAKAHFTNIVDSFVRLTITNIIFPRQPVGKILTG
jgi:hypothetical protein